MLLAVDILLSFTRPRVAVSERKRLLLLLVSDKEATLQLR